MRLANKGGIGFYEKESFRVFRVRKRIYQFFRYRSGMDQKVLFLVGCQRSGTSMVHRLLRLDYDTVTYDEISPLSTKDPKGLRLAHCRSSMTGSGPTGRRWWCPSRWWNPRI